MIPLPDILEGLDDQKNEVKTAAVAVIRLSE
jgi:hypothetical protein